MLVLWPLEVKKKQTREAIVAITWTLLAYGGAFMIGLTALTLYQGQVFDDVEMILPFMILDLMPPWIAGILLAGILAAIISTADSQLLVITSSVSEDIIRHALNWNLTEKKTCPHLPNYNRCGRDCRINHRLDIQVISLPRRQLGVGRSGLYPVTCNHLNIFLETIFGYWCYRNNHFWIC